MGSSGTEVNRGQRGDRQNKEGRSEAGIMLVLE